METRGASGAGFQGRSLLSCLFDLYPELAECGFCAAAVGGGGKTGTLFALASSLADAGRAVILTTTTHIRDPRSEKGRRFDELLFWPALADPPSARLPGTEPLAADASLRPPAGGSAVKTALGAAIHIIASAAIAGPDGPLLAGINPSQAPRLRARCHALLVEADGSRMLPIKAPASHEPALPEGVDIVLGLIGLDCLAKPMDAASVHRPELFGPLTGCAAGEAIEPRHLRALAESTQGLFKGCPAKARRLLVLNKAELFSEEALDALARALGEPPPRGVDAAFFYSSRSDAARLLALARARRMPS